MERETALQILLDSAFKNEITEEVNTQAMFLIENIKDNPTSLEIYDGFVEIGYNYSDPVKYFISPTYISANRRSFWTNYLSVETALEQYQGFSE